LIANHEEFKNRVWGQRELEILAANSPKEGSENGFDLYDEEAKELRERFGFPAKEDVKKEPKV
jgi:hypothetical protein